jgi:hypothetical protein
VCLKVNKHQPFRLGLAVLLCIGLSRNKYLFIHIFPLFAPAILAAIRYRSALGTLENAAQLTVASVSGVPRVSVLETLPTGNQKNRSLKKAVSIEGNSRFGLICNYNKTF